MSAAEPTLRLVAPPSASSAERRDGAGSDSTVGGLRAELAAARAELAAARAQLADANAAAAAARELNVALLAALHRPAGPSAEHIQALEARAALADEMAATRLWRWAHHPRRVYAALRRLLRVGSA